MKAKAPAVPLAIVAIVFCLVSTLTSFVYHERVLDHLRSVERDLEKENIRMLTTKWTSGGNERTLSTPRNDGEDVIDWANRHKTDVTACKLVFPEDEDPDSTEGK